MLWFLAGLAIWAILVVSTLVGVRSDLEEAEAALTSVAESDDLLAADVDQLLSDLTGSQDRLANARAALDRRPLRPLGWLPVVGRQYRSAKALVRTADDVVSAAIPVLRAAEPSRIDRGDPIDSIRLLSDRLTTFAGVVRGVDLGPTDALAPELAEGRNRLAVQLAELEAEVTRAELGLAALDGLLTDGRYVVLGANNGEMQMGSGMPLFVGELELTEGDVELREFGPSEFRFPVTGAEVVNDDLETTWGFLSPANDYRKLTLSADFPAVVGPQALELWRADTGRTLDGVIALDVVALQSMVAVAGPIESGGVVFDGDAVGAYLLLEQYEEFSLDQRDARRDRLGLLAEDVLASVVESDWDPVEMLAAMREVVAGGHLRIYSASAPDQRGWEALGVAGRRAPDETGVFLLNLGASKLDPFVAVDVEVDTERVGDLVRYRYGITLANEATPSVPVYVAGEWEAIGLPVAGTYLGRLAVAVPANAVDAGFVGERTIEVIGPDGFLDVHVSRVEIAPGASERIAFEFSVESERVPAVIPGARVPAATWSVDGSPVDEGEQLSARDG